MLFCKFKLIFYNSKVDLLKFINILIVGYLALISSLLELFYIVAFECLRQQYKKRLTRAGKWITDKAQTIRFKLINNLILGIKKRINSRAYPLYLWNWIHYSADSVVSSEEVSGASGAFVSAAGVSDFLAFPPRRLLAFFSSFLPPL